MPYLVDTVLPSISGNRSRCTPSRDTSAPPLPSLRRQTLSISSRKTIPFCSAASTALAFIFSSLTSLLASSSCNCFNASTTVTLRVEVLPWPILLNIPCSWLVISSIPGGAIISTPAGICLSSISISLSLSAPSRSFLRKICRVEPSLSVAASALRAGGSSASNTRSSAASIARCATFSISCSRRCFTDVSTRSRIMDSTSLPT